jgi:hypothetical protein
VKNRETLPNLSSIGEQKLNDRIQDPSGNSNKAEAKAVEEPNTPEVGYFKRIDRSRQFIVYMMEQRTFHYAIIILIIIDLIVVFVELVPGKLYINDRKLKKYCFSCSST